MTKVFAGMTVSLDGFVNDRNGSVGSLYPDLAALGSTEMLQESIRRTGAVVMGRRSFEMANDDLTGYEYQVPIFVVTHTVPDTVIRGVNDRLFVTFVTDGPARAIERARAAAREKDVTVVGGASTIRQLLELGLVDELHVGFMPILLGDGLRFFEAGSFGPTTLEPLDVIESGSRTDLLYRVQP